MFFCANTVTTTTISPPTPAQVDDGRLKVKVLFSTPTGALAGVVSPDVKFLSLSRIGDQGRNTTSPAVVDGLFLAPSGFTKAENGTQALVNGEEQALRGVPKPNPSITDRPLPPIAHDTRFAECLKDRPVPDADQFQPGVTAEVSATDTIVLGRFGDVLLYCLDSAQPMRGMLYEPDDMDEVTGRTIASAAAFVEFAKQQDGSSRSGNLTAVGLVTDPRVASVTYIRPGTADIAASLANGTFVLAAPLIDRHPDARVVVRDAAGVVLETITPRTAR